MNDRLQHLGRAGVSNLPVVDLPSKEALTALKTDRRRWDEGRPIYRSDADALMRMLRMEYTYPPMRFGRDWLEIDYNGHTIRGATVPGDNCSAKYDKQTAELSHLGELHKSGLLSEADFETAKSKVLDT